MEYGKTIVNMQKWMVSNYVGGRKILFLLHEILTSTTMLEVIMFPIKIRLLVQRNVMRYLV